MSVKIFVWMPHGYSMAEAWRGEPRAVGHAAVEVEGSGPNIYISWWPNDADRQTKSGKLRSGFWGVVASNHRSVHVDSLEEGGRAPIAVDLSGLDEAGIREWWARCEKTHWSLLNTNCSQMAVDALRAGGADKYVGGNWLTHYYTTRSVVWRPRVVLDYARAVHSGLHPR